MAQTREGLDDLKNQFQEWVDRRRGADRLRRHRQQLNALEQVVETCLEAIGGTLDPLLSLPVREAYEGCREADHRGAFVRRLWSYFRERWDQRDDTSLAPVLAAADEVIWSCYQPPFRRLERSPGPAPLAYVTPEFSAHAIDPGSLPPPLRESDRLLSETVSKLPVPLIGLPYSCVVGPWWLVLIAHEVGHQIAYAVDELEGEPRIADLVAGAVGGAGAPLEVQRRWRAWSHEVFADSYAAATVGTAHLWALVELEQGSDETMVREPVGYPPPLVRHELVARLVERLGVSWEEAVPRAPGRVGLEELDLPAEEGARTARLLEDVPRVVEALATAEVVAGVSLAELTEWDAASLARQSDAGWWMTQFRSSRAAAEEELSAARFATIGGFAAWSELDEEDDESRRQRANALRQQMLAVLPECREPGYRSQESVSLFDLDALGRQVAAEVLRLSPEDPPPPEPLGR